MDKSSISGQQVDDSVYRLPSFKNVLRLAACIGIGAGKVLFFVLLAFGLVNFGLIVYALVRTVSADFGWRNIAIFGLIVLISIGCTLLACYLTYRYLLLLMIQKVYDLTLDQRIKISEDVIHQVGTTFEGKQQWSQKQVEQAVDWSRILYRYYQAVPIFFQSGITQYLYRIPITGYLIDLKEDIRSGNHSAAAEKFRVSIDTFFKERILGNPSNRMAWLLLLINVVVIYAIIVWGIK